MLGPLAQLVEQRTLNPLVVGSIPTRPTNQNEGLVSDRQALCFCSEAPNAPSLEPSRDARCALSEDYVDVVCDDANGTSIKCPIPPPMVLQAGRLDTPKARTSATAALSLPMMLSIMVLRDGR